MKTIIMTSLLELASNSTLSTLILSLEIANIAHENGITLKEAALRTGYLSEKEFEKWVKPEDMIGKN